MIVTPEISLLLAVIVVVVGISFAINKQASVLEDTELDRLRRTVREQQQSIVFLLESVSRMQEEIADLRIRRDAALRESASIVEKYNELSDRFKKMTGV